MVQKSLRLHRRLPPSLHGEAARSAGVVRLVRIRHGRAVFYNATREIRVDAGNGIGT